jgi:hypothetical protein
MMTLEQILECWKRDCVIDEMNLDTASIDTAKLHAKYLELLGYTKLQLRKLDNEFKILLRDKWMYYEGKLTKEEMDERKWDYDPFKGMSKPLKSNMDYYYDADEHIQLIQSKIEYHKTVKDTLEEIISTLRWRHQTIRNVVEWRRFTSGA